MSRRTLTLCLIGAAFLFMLLRIELAVTHRFDIDEFEHVHSAWSMAQGLALYKDFFEHHPPLFYLTISPLLHVLEGRDALIALRLAMLPLALGVLVLVYALASELRNREAGAWAVLLLSTTILFVQKSIEIRPDVPALLLLLISAYLLVSRPRSPQAWAGAGFAAACSLAFTPKTAFALAGFLLACAWIHRSDVRRLRLAAAFAAGVAVPVVGLGGYLLATDAVSEAWFYNVEFNALVPYQYQWGILISGFTGSLAQNYAFWFLSCLALGRGLVLRTRPGDFVISGGVLGAILGILVIQVPLRQYLMVIVSLLCVLLAVAVIDLAERVQRRQGEWLTGWALAILAVVMIVPGALGFAAERRDTNDEQFARLEYVWEHTEPQESVFDCWSGLYVFRPHAFFYHFLGPDIRPTLDLIDPAILRRDLPAALRKNRPRVVFADPSCDELPAEARRYIDEHYESGRYPEILLRR